MEECLFFSLLQNQDALLRNLSFYYYFIFKFKSMIQLLKKFKCYIITMVVKIPIWILRSYDFTISPTQNDLNLSRIFAVVQNR